MESLNSNQIKNLIKMKIIEAKQECFDLANPLGLSYEQLSHSERVLFDFCAQIDGYDTDTLEKLNNIISKMFYE